MKPYYADPAVTVYQADALDLLRCLPDASVQLIATDPPYFRVKDEAWDNAWPSERAFLLWMRDLCREWRRVLAPNGSLYVFASPQMAHGVERVARRSLRVLSNIRWRKPPFSTKAEMFDKDDLRAPFPASETVLFCEQYGNGPYEDADQAAKDASGYWSACEAAKRSTFGDYMRAEFARAGVTSKQIAALFPSRTGGLTGCVSNWLLGYNCPTEEQWQAMREFLHRQAGGDYLRREYEDLRREYEDLRREYEDLRREYEDLRREYEDLRRPFNATADNPYTDVWDFPTVSQYPGKHPTEKPLAMFEHIVRVSSRPGDTVLDTFSGSGTTAEAARNLGRRAIVGDSDPHWCRQTALRVSQGSLLAEMDGAA